MMEKTCVPIPSFPGIFPSLRKGDPWIVRLDAQWPERCNQFNPDALYRWTPHDSPTIGFHWKIRCCGWGKLPRRNRRTPDVTFDLKITTFCDRAHRVNEQEMNSISAERRPFHSCSPCRPERNPSPFPWVQISDEGVFILPIHL